MARGNAVPTDAGDISRLIARVENLERFFKPGGPDSLEALTDVDITDPLANDVLTYVPADGKWENKPVGAASGGTDQFLDLSGAALGTSDAILPWVVNTSGSLAVQPGNLVPDTLGGNPVARVTTAGSYVVTCTVAVALISGSDTQARVDGAVIQVGTGKAKTLDGGAVPLPAGPYVYGQLAGAKVVLPFIGEVGDLVIIQASIGAGLGVGLLLATALSIV